MVGTFLEFDGLFTLFYYQFNSNIMDTRLKVKMNFKKGKRLTVETAKKSVKDPTGAIRQKRYRDRWRADDYLKLRNVMKCQIEKYRDDIKQAQKINNSYDEQCRKKEKRKKS